MSSGRPFTIDSSALVEPKTDRATTKALVLILPVSTTNQIKISIILYPIMMNKQNGLPMS
jgi:hypothetical protein